MAKGDGVVDNSLVDDDLEGDGVVVNDEAEELVDDKEGKDEKDETREADGEREELEIVIEGDDDADAPDQGALNEDEKEEKGAKDQSSQEKYSKDVRARIGREQRIARDATVRATTANQRALAAEAKSRAVQKDALDITEQALESHIKATSATLLKAKEDGKSEDEIKLQSELNKLESRREAVAVSKRNLDAEIEAAKRGGAAEGPNPLAQDWMRRNKWFTDPRFAEQAAHTRLIDKALELQGYDKTSTEYFAELDRRIGRRLPEIVKLRQRQGNEDGGERPAAQRKPAREPTGGVQRSAGASGAGKGKVVLTQADLANMRSFGIDTTDKAALREYALNKTPTKGAR